MSNYITTIYLKKDLSLEKCKELEAIANKEYDNVIGTIKNSSTDPYVLIYESNSDSEYCCDGQASFELYDRNDFRPYIDKWTYTDNVLPCESVSDVLAAIKKAKIRMAV